MMSALRTKYGQESNGIEIFASAKKSRRYTPRFSAALKFWGDGKNTVPRERPFIQIRKPTKLGLKKFPKKVKIIEETLNLLRVTQGGKL